MRRHPTSSLAILSLAAPVAVTALLASAAACSSSSSGGAPVEAGTSETGAADARTDTKAPDATTDATSSDAAADAGPPGLTCGKLLACDQGCSTSACTDACYASATGAAQGIFSALNACIDATCPSTGSADGGPPCADAGSSTCSTCQSQAATGACSATLLTCEGDKTVGPADPDGGSASFDAGAPVDAGPALNCGNLEACEGSCGDAGAGCAAACVASSTPTAQALANQLESCLTTACPYADAGVCSSAGSACTGCRTQAEFDPSVCGTPFSACQADTSNSPDAGAGPVALLGGSIVTLASGLDQPQVVIIQGGFVFYSQVTSTAPVSKVALGDGGTAPVDLNPSQPYPMGLALDSTNIYAWNSGSFTGASTLNEKNGSVVQIPLAGGAPTTLATGIEAAYAAPYLNAIAVNAGSLYWVAGASGIDGTIMTTAVGSTTPAALYSGQPFPEAVVTDGTNLYWANWGTFDASGSYNNDGTVVRGPLGGGAVTTLASGLSAPAALAVDATNVYWTNAGQLGGSNIPAPGTGSVMQVPKTGGTVVTLAKNVAIPLGITVGASSVYWNEYTLSAPGRIVSAPIGGGTLVPVAAGLAEPFGITVSGKTLVWTDSPPTQAGSGKVLSLTLP
jgi:hypothetical protein